MVGDEFQKSEEVLYFDRGTGQHLLGKVVDVDRMCDPPSYAVHIPSLNTTRETVASRLRHANQANGQGPASEPPASAAAAAAAAAGDKRDAGEPASKGVASQPKSQKLSHLSKPFHPSDHNSDAAQGEEGQEELEVPHHRRRHRRHHGKQHKAEGGVEEDGPALDKPSPPPKPRQQGNLHAASGTGDGGSRHQRRQPGAEDRGTAGNPAAPPRPVPTSGHAQQQQQHGPRQRVANFWPW